MTVMNVSGVIAILLGVIACCKYKITSYSTPFLIILITSHNYNN